MNEELARKAAKWWADQLRNGAKLDNGDPSTTGVMTMMMGLLNQQHAAAERTPEQEQAFEDALTEILLALDDQHARWGFGVDYHPGGILQDAAEQAGIDVDMCCLPWKTHMHFEDGEVKVACGYAAPLETL